MHQNYCKEDVLDYYFNFTKISTLTLLTTDIILFYIKKSMINY